MDQPQRDLLATFVDGPRIWDAADLFKIVCELHDTGYVKIVGDGPLAEITDVGRAALWVCPVHGDECVTHADCFEEITGTPFSHPPESDGQSVFLAFQRGLDQYYGRT